MVVGLRPGVENEASKGVLALTRDHLSSSKARPDQTRENSQCGIVRCHDGHIIIATGNDGQYRRLCGLLGLADMAEAPEFLKNSDRITNRDKMVSQLMQKTKTFSKDALLNACEAAGVPAGPINDMAQVFADPQVIARKMQLNLDGIPSVRSPFQFSEASLNLTRSSPRLGEYD